jgi:hypothetical protein
MPYPFIRDTERGREPTPSKSLGIVVYPPGGRRYFFPGATPDLGMIIAKPVLGDTLENPLTVIEFGEVNGTAWIMKQVVKAPMPELTG